MQFVGVLFVRILFVRILFAKVSAYNSSKHMKRFEVMHRHIGWNREKKWYKKGQELCIFTMEVVLILLLFLCFQDLKKVETISVSNAAAIEEAKKIALTFDDGPHPVYTEMLLDGLKERGVKASFFVLGKNAEIYPELVSRLQEEGHLIGNHTYSHIQLTKRNAEKFEEELLQTAKLLQDITGQGIQYVRPPYGAWDKTYEKKWNMLPILWNIDPKDWKCNSADLIARRVIAKAEDHGIILLHDEYESSVLAAFQIIDELKKQGYEFVTVDEILFD